MPAPHNTGPPERKEAEKRRLGGANKAPSNTSQLILALQDAKHQPVGQGEVESLKPATDCPKGHRPCPRWHSAHPHLMPTRGKGEEQLPGRVKTRMIDANPSPGLQASRHTANIRTHVLNTFIAIYCKNQTSNNITLPPAPQKQRHAKTCKPGNTHTCAEQTRRFHTTSPPRLFLPQILR